MPADIRTALIGRGIRESSSPALHETEGAALGLDYRYRLIDLDDNGGTEALPIWLDRLQRDGYSGSNITYPVKQAVIPLLDRLSPEAEAIGAVNTVKFASDGAREGHNTDWWGFAENLRRTLGNNPLGHVVLIGAGGAGAAAAYALTKLGASRLTIFDNDVHKASALVVLLAPSGARVETLPLTSLAETLAVADGLVQATPIGMLKYPGMPFDPAYLHAGLWVAEIIYVPVDTELVRRARAIGMQDRYRGRNGRAPGGRGIAYLHRSRAGHRTNDAQFSVVGRRQNDADWASAGVADTSGVTDLI